jgi:hypothetical protein
MSKQIYECYDEGTSYIDCKNFDVAKLTTMTSLSLLIKCIFSFPIVGLNIFSKLSLAFNFL